MEFWANVCQRCGRYFDPDTRAIRTSAMVEPENARGPLLCKECEQSVDCGPGDSDGEI